MLDVQTVMMFITTSILLTLAPGPDILFVLTQSMTSGSRSGIMIALGLCSGLIVHTTAVALGVAVIFQTSLIAFTILKIVGAAYLLYLAYQCFKASSKSALNAEKKAYTMGFLYKRGIVMNITNPKVTIFFLAFLPQFTNPEMGNVTAQIFTLGGLFMASAFSVFCVVALLAGRLGEWFAKTKHGEKILNRLSGTIFAALALKLAMSSR